MKKYAGLFASILTCAALSFTAFAEGDVVETFVSDDSIIAELVSIEGDIASGYTWNIHVENKTDKEIQIAMDNAIVNGLELSPYWTQVISAGESSDTQATWTADQFAEVGMTGDVTEVRFELRAFDTEEYNTFLQEEYSIRPNGDEVVYYERTPLDTDQVVFSNDACEMVLFDSVLNQWDEFELKAYLVNKSDSVIFVEGENWKINGTTECDPYWSVILYPHSAAYSDIYWSEYALSGTGISAFESIDCDITITDWDSWSTIDTKSLSLTLGAPVPVTGGDVTEVTPDTEHAPEPRKNPDIDTVQNVLESGADGKTWDSIFK